MRSDEGAALVARLRHHVDRLRPGHPTPIVPVVLGDEAAAVGRRGRPARRGLLVPAIRPPTVPVGTSRLRVALSAAHTDAHIDRLDRRLTGLRAVAGAARSRSAPVAARRPPPDRRAGRARGAASDARGARAPGGDGTGVAAGGLPTSAPTPPGLNGVAHVPGDDGDRGAEPGDLSAWSWSSARVPRWARPGWRAGSSGPCGGAG